MRRRVVLVLSALAALALSWMWINPANAMPTIQSITTDPDYETVTVSFGESVSGSGTAGAFVTTDVSVGDGAGATLTSVAQPAGKESLALGFDGPVQPGTSLTINVSDAGGLTFVTEVPVAADDWTAIDASLRAIVLPVADVPLVSYLATDPATPRTLGELLPPSMPTSIQLPAGWTVARDADGSFTVTGDSTTLLKSIPIAPSVELGTVGGTAYGLDLTSSTDVDLDVALGGTVDLDEAGTTTSAALTIELDATAPAPASPDAGPPTLTGGIGIAEATVEWDFDLDISIQFDHIPPSEDVPSGDVPTVRTASVTLGDVTVPGLGAAGADIEVTGDALLQIDWPTMPASEAAVTVADGGWTAGDLPQLANVSMNDLLGAPGGIASWLSAAQTIGTLDTSLPIVPDTLGDGIGVAQSLATVHDRVAAATAVAFGPLADTPAPHLSPDLCADLAPSAVRAAKVVKAVEVLDPEGKAAPTTEEILAELPNVTVDETATTDAFTAACGYLFGDVVIDLDAGTIESEVAIPEATFDFFGLEKPSVDLSTEHPDLESLAVALDGGAWSGTSNPKVDFTLGLKLDSASSLVEHKLAVDLGEAIPDPDADPEAEAEPAPLVAPDADDVTAAYRVYVPGAETLATSTVTVTGTGLTGFGQLGFLDLAITGDVAMDPAVALTAKDVDTGFADGKADLLELLAAAIPDETGDTEIDDVLAVSTGTDDVDAHFELSNAVVGTDADLDVVGDVAGLIDGDIDARNAAIDGPAAVAEGELAVGHTLGDATELAALPPAQVIGLVADALDAIAGSAAARAGDVRIPVVDVSLNEVTGLRTGLTDAATAIRTRAPGSVTELQDFVDDALASKGLPGVAVGFAPVGASGDPELTLTLDAGISEAASYPLSFELPGAGAGDFFSIGPTDGGARLDAAVEVDFAPVLGMRLDPALPLADAVFVRDLGARFDFFLSGNAEGSITFGPAEASVTGNVSIGDDVLDEGGFTAALTTKDGDSTIPLASLLTGDVELAKDGSVPVDASLELEVPTPFGAVTGAMGVSGSVPGKVTFSAPAMDYSALTDYFKSLKPNLRTLADGAIQTSRFIARGSEEVAALSGQVPVVGADVAAQFDAASVILDDVADEIQAVVDLLDDDANNPALLLQDEIDTLLEDIGCTLCAVDVRYTPPGTEKLLDAEGIEVLLTIAGEKTFSDTASASFGLDPVLDLDVDITDATANIGFVASIGLGVDIHDGFYLFPGIDPDEDDGVGNLFELYAGLNLDSDIALNIAGLTATAEDAKITVGGALDGGTAGGLKIEMPDRLLIRDLVNRSRKMSDVLKPSLDAVISADIPVEVALEVVPDEPFRLVLPLVFDWTIEDTLKPDISTATFDVEEAGLDIGALAGFLGGVVREFDDGYNPLGIKEVKAALDTMVPLIDVTVRDTLSAACKLTLSAGCKAFDALANLGQVATDLEALSGELLPIGSFQIYPAPPKGTPRYTPPAGLATAQVAPVASAPAVAPPATPPPSNPGTMGLKAKIQALTGGYMTLPILESPGTLIGIVLGGELGDDVDIVRFEIPEDEPIVLGKSFAIKRELLKLDTAFIDGNLSVNLNGGLGLNISGGFGFSTRAISTGDPANGIFLVDNGGLEVSVGASISAEVNGRFGVLSGLAEVQFRGAGSFSAVGGIDLFDESPVLVGRGGGDGRLFFDEIATIADAYEPPFAGAPSELCMFQLRTTGKWSLAFSGSAKVLGFTVFDESFSDSGTLWDETLSCKLRPRIARVEDRVLILHAGPNAGDRFDGEGDVAETFVLAPAGDGQVEVSWPGSDKRALTFALDSFDSIVADMGAGADSVTIGDAIGQPVLGRGGPGADSIDGGGGPDDLAGGPDADSISGGTGDDVLRGGDGADTLDGGTGDDDLDGQGGADTIASVDGFGQDGVVDSGPSSDVDELDFSGVSEALSGDSSYGDSTVSAGSNESAYPATDFERVLGGGAGDEFVLKDREPNGFVVDGGGGSDHVTFLSGRRGRQVGATDSGDDTDTDTVTVVGGSGRDQFLLRAGSTGLDQTATAGFVARLSGDLADRYDYDSSIEDLTVDGGVGDDSFSLDDNATATHVVGGEGADVIQVGQLYGAADCEPDGTDEDRCSDTADIASERGSASGVADPFATTVITRGHLSNGVSNPLVVDGDAGADRITIFANHAPVKANGGDGNDEFVARAFIITASLELNGDGDIDDFSYVMNDQLAIDGGAGTDTFTIVGTEANDGVIVATDDEGRPSVRVCKLDAATGRPDPGECAISAVVDRVEIFTVLGLEGDDVFWIQDSVVDSTITLSGGEHSDRFLVGDGTLDGIGGPVIAAGDDAGLVPAIPAPVVLPGEDDTVSFDPLVTGGSDVGDTLEVDASDASDDLDGEITASAIRGLGMADGPFKAGEDPDVVESEEVLAYRQLEFVQIDLGEGADDVTVFDTHVGSGDCTDHGCPLKLATGGGDDVVDVESISGETWLDLGDGADTADVTDDGTVDAIDAHLKVVGGEGGDTLDLDDSADEATRLDVDPNLISEAGLDAEGVSHETVEDVHVRLGDEDDTVNVRGTATDAVLTEVHGNGGDDRFAVSSAADFALGEETEELGGTVDDVHSGLRLHGDGGSRNVLQVSDHATEDGDLAVAYDGTTLSGLSLGAISHDVDGAFGGGITVWTSEDVDAISVSGSDASRVGAVHTLTTFDTGDGADRVAVALDDDQGAFVVNAEEGDDVVDATTSVRDLIVFGGLGADTITGGSGDDIVFGDVGSASSADGRTTTGFGGTSDRTDGTQPIDLLTDRTVEVVGDGAQAQAAATGTGAPDTIHGGGGDDTILGQTGDDALWGDDDHDTIYGNGGGDTIDGGGGQDDLTGGGSTLDGVLDGDRTWATSTTAGAARTGLADGNDTIEGGAGADVVLGDNGWIVRPTDAGAAVRLADDVFVRDARVSSGQEVDGSYGADRLSGGDGPDELHGQRDTTRTTPGGNGAVGTAIEGDELDGGAGDDVLIGDLGRVETVLEDGTRSAQVRDNSPFLSAALRTEGSRTRYVTLFRQHDADHVDKGDGSDRTQFGAEGDDVLLGGPGADAIHGGAGDDVANGGEGADVIFGGDGDDAAWGGPGVDEVFGGHDQDSLDVVPRARTTAKGKAYPADPPLWFEVAGDKSLALGGLDILYGGWDSDTMQADQKSNGPTPGDRLIDWNGAYNRYLSCSNGAGAGSFLRVQSPSLRAFLVDVAAGRGAVDAGTSGTSGHRELGLVTSGNTGSVGGLEHVAC